MLFNSLTFAVFLMLALLLYRLLPGWGARRNLLLLASYLFYAAWSPPFALLLAFSTLLDWLLARRMGREPEAQRRRRWLMLSLLANLGLLGYFKYGEFLQDNFRLLLQAFAIDYAPPQWSIVLPVGISFYTFQTLSYTIDVYRRRIQPEPSLRDFALFVSFFPQLVAGPIVRAADFLPQIKLPKTVEPRLLAWGGSLLVIGLFLKTVIADAILAPVVDDVYAHAVGAARFDAITAVLAFSGQIYADFAGYSICAIGTALCFGFVLPENFQFPYAATGFSDFWRRWHISLSTWLRDYLYLPLGGRSSSFARRARNLLLTMGLGGLWHGASWMFVLWGLLHGSYLVIEHATRARWRDHLQRWATPWTLPLVALCTFTLVSLTWIPFRATDGATALAVWNALWSGAGNSSLAYNQTAGVWLVMGMMLLGGWFARERSLECLHDALSRPARALVMMLMAASIVMVSGGDERAFLYFQF